MSSRKPRPASAGSTKPTTATASPPRRRRPRPTPSWLTERQDLDEMARRRCLLVLSVLSGQRPVTDVIEEVGISRGMYYELEERALNGMLSALVPGVSTMAAPLGDAAARRADELEAKVAKLEQEKRRLERLLLLTRKVVKSGPVKTAYGRPSHGRKRRGSTTRGSAPSAGSPRTTATTSTASGASSATTASPAPAPSAAGTTPPAASIPTTDGAGAR